jgi:hypothetical protein
MCEVQSSKPSNMAHCSATCWTASSFKAIYATRRCNRPSSQVQRLNAAHDHHMTHFFNLLLFSLPFSLQSPLQLQQEIVAGVVASLTMFPIQDPVCVLLQTPFRRWSDNDKKDFLTCERPMPLLNANQVRKVGNKVYYRNFNKSRYSQFEWLCGSYYLDKLFCFPCLIVDDKAGLWNKTGFNDLKNLGRGLHRHEESLEHLRCALDFSKLKKNLTCGDGAQENSRQHVSKQFNENMQRNRHFMQLPILAIMYLGRQELPFGHGNFEELLRVLSMSPGYLQEHYKQIKTVFADKTIQNDLVDSISQYIDEHVEKEIQESKFYSIQVEDISDVVQSPQCSVSVRYVNSWGKLVERFLGFHAGSNRTANAMFELVLNCVEKWHYKSKLIGQSFDGASVVPAQLDILQAKIKDVAPQALLVHCLAHPLNSVLQQSCNSVSTCRVFFATVSDLPTFFSRLKGTAIVRRIPASAIARWTSSSDILSVVNNDWDSLKQVFTEVMNDSSYDSTCVRQSEAFLNKFNQFEFALLVVVFHDVFRLTGALCEALQKNSLDVRFCVVQVGNTLTRLNSKRSGVVFEKMFDLAALKALPSEGQKGKCEMLYYEILDALSLQISTRFKDMEKLEFVALMDNSKFQKYSQNFPMNALSSLKLSYPNVFTSTCLQRLKNELQLVYGDEEFRNKEQNFMKILTDHMNIFKETYKLFCLILTMPSIGVSAKSSFSCSERIKSYLRDTTEERLTSLAKISIERELLEELIDEQPFYDDIIDKFVNLNEIPKQELGKCMHT